MTLISKRMRSSTPGLTSASARPRCDHKLRYAAVVRNGEAVERGARRHVHREVGRYDANQQAIGRPVAVVTQADFVEDAFAGVDELRRRGDELRALRELRLGERRNLERRELDRADAFALQPAFERDRAIAQDRAQQAQRDARFVGRLGGNVAKIQTVAIAAGVDRAFERESRAEPSARDARRAVRRIRRW